MSKFVKYIRDSKAELTHVSWPTQRQAIIFTALVVAISILVALFLGAFDYVFTQGINWVIGG